jgi:hypothetical protein
MNRDDVTRMAREAGALQIGFNKTIMQSEYSMFAHELERFAALVAAAEREAVCRIVTGLCVSDNNAEEINRAIRARGEKL